MNLARFGELTSLYTRLRIAVVGDFCLDRYFDIDPARSEVSLETGLAVHNIVRVRCQPGAAGTILNNLVALGIGEIHPIGACGADGEGWELLESLGRKAGVKLDHFVQSPEIRTFTYTKPLICEAGKPPVELNRLDIKNWSPTPPRIEQAISGAVGQVIENVDAMIVLDQVDIAETGVVTRGLLRTIEESLPRAPSLPIIADSRRGLAGFPPVILKMNAHELSVLTGMPGNAPFAEIERAASDLARKQGRAVIVTLAERGMVGASADGGIARCPAIPTRGEIDIVGAGDAVTANLAASLAGGATVPEAIELASAAASIVIHQLGTTGTASVEQIAQLNSQG